MNEEIQNFKMKPFSDIDTDIKINLLKKLNQYLFNPDLDFNFTS